MAAAPRGRTTATASRPFLTPPATVTPAGADLTLTDFAPEATTTAIWPSAGTATERPFAA